MESRRAAKDIFLEALEIDGRARDDFVARACAGDRLLEARVRDLIAADEGADAAEWFTRGPLPAGRATVPENLTVIAAIEALQGSAPRLRLPAEGDVAGTPGAAAVVQRLPLGPKGNYEILGEIARGGMGVVLRGRDTDLGREVAVKVLREDLQRSPLVVERFVEEAQIGGQLQHPGIVPVYELGLMGGERPYFTMKLVRGRTFKELLRDRADASTDLVRMISIFEHVAQTVAYAHSRRVIHRDLKPGNVMVGRFGEVQVVDWGLAKVIDPGAVEGRARQPVDESATIETVRSREGSSTGSGSLAGSVMGTPAYMSPEQARGEVGRLDERTDVFALGAILCEILTGDPPYVHARKSSLAMAAQADLAPAVQRLEQCGADEQLVALALACLSPAPPARPRSAAVVAATLADYTAAVEQRLKKAQISAVTERTRATAARKIQRMATLAAGLVALALVVSVFLWRRATEAAQLAIRAGVAEGVAKDALDGKNRELERANVELSQTNADLATALERAGEETRKAVAVSEFLTDLLSSSIPMKGGRHDLTVREAIDAALADVERGDFADQPDVESSVRRAAGEALAALGEYEAGRRQLERGRELALAHHGAESDASLGMLAEIGGAWRSLGRLDLAEQAFRQVLDSLGGVKDVTPHLESEVIGGLASVARDRGEYERAEVLGREAVALARELGNLEVIAKLLNDLAIALSDLGRLDEAIAMQREANALDLQVRGREHYGTAVSLTNLAGYSSRAGRVEEAEALYAEALGILRATAGARHPFVATALSSLGLVHLRQRKYYAAWSELTMSLEIRLETLPADHVDVAFGLNNLATLEVELGLIDDAVVHLVQAQAIFRAALGEEHPHTVKVTRNLVGARQRQGQPRDAVAHMRRLADEAQESLGATAIETGHWKQWLAGALVETGELAEAREQYTDALAIFEENLGADSPQCVEVMNALGGVLAEVGELDDAELLVRRALALRREELGSRHTAVAQSLTTLARILVERGDADQALRALAESIEIFTEVLPPHHWRLASARSDRAALLVEQGLFREAERDLSRAHEDLVAAFGQTHPTVRLAVERLVQLYTAWSTADPAADHQTHLDTWTTLRDR